MASEGGGLSGPVVTAVIGVLSLFVTGLVALWHQPMREDIVSLRRDVNQLLADPHPKPETRVKLEAIDEELSSIVRKMERVEERINHLHLYLMQAIPPPKSLVTPPSRRGDLPPLIEQGKQL